MRRNIKEFVENIRSLTTEELLALGVSKELVEAILKLVDLDDAGASDVSRDASVDEERS
jgi:hypothetical protein